MVFIGVIMNNKYIIKKSDEFNNIIRTSKYVNNKYFTLYYNKVGKKHTRVGIAVSKKLGKAHLRNKLKRQTREILRLNYNLFNNKYDYIVLLRNDVLKLNYKDKEKYLINLIKKVENESKK